jgi:Fe-Mn family superoxide dismutase
MARKSQKRYLTTGRQGALRPGISEGAVPTRRRPLTPPPIDDVPPTPQEAASSRADRFAARDFSGLLGLEGLSEALLRTHFELYQGYVKNANKILDELDELRKADALGTCRYAELKRRFPWEYDSIRLHELYFDNLSRRPVPLDPASTLHRRLSDDFGSVDSWRKDFRATGAIRGVGWAVLYLDALRNRLFNAWIEQHHEGHFAGCVPILVMDVFEHAYTLDYGVKKADYIEVLLRNIHWDAVTARLP